MVFNKIIFQEILLAFGLRNSLIYFRPFEKLEYFWATQFADFFNVVDYGVPGYIPPAVYVKKYKKLNYNYLKKLD
jgi:hypothetical protein